MFLVSILLVTQSSWAGKPGYEQIIGAWAITGESSAKQSSLHFYYDNTLKLVRADGSVARGNWVLARNKLKMYTIVGRSRAMLSVDLNADDQLTIDGDLEFSGHWQRFNKQLIRFLWG